MDRRKGTKLMVDSGNNAKSFKMCHESGLMRIRKGEVTIISFTPLPPYRILQETANNSFLELCNEPGNICTQLVHSQDMAYVIRSFLKQVGPSD